MRRMKALLSSVPVAESEFAEGAPSADKEGRPTRPTRPLPSRPSLPPTLGCALGLWASCAALFTIAETWDRSACLVGVAFALLLLIPAGAMLWKRRAVQVWAVVLGVALGGVCACACATLQHTTQAPIANENGRWMFEAIEDGSSNAYGTSCLARARIPDVGDVILHVRFPEGVETPRYGTLFDADATCAATSETSSAYYWRQGAVGEAQLSKVVFRERNDLLGMLMGVRNRAIDAITCVVGEGAAVLAALVCGWREGLDAGSVYDAFKATGLAHIVAVSGAHLSIVSAFAACALRLLRMPRALATALQIGLILSYLVLTAVPPSAVRAACMTCAGMVSFAARRRPAALNALCVCMIVCIAVSPRTALSVSFALSALSTLGIVVFSRLFTAWIARIPLPLPQSACEALSLTGASSVMATPLSAALFAQLPLIAPLANVVVAPLFPLVCTFGLVATLGSVVFPPAASFLIPAAAAATGAFTQVVQALAGVPYASIPFTLPLSGALAFTIVVAAALWMCWPKPRLRTAIGAGVTLACLSLSLIVLVPRLTADEIIMLDVGQGDAFIIRSEGATVLIDTGNKEQLLREALARHGIVRLDAVIITHGDDDHKGALISLRGVVKVDRVLLANDALSCSCDACDDLRVDACTLVGESHVEGLKVGDTLEVGVFALEVVWPHRFSDEGGNADSLCLGVQADVDADGQGDWSALFVGDAERDQLAELVQSSAIGAVDIYKVGHHGSKNALDEQLAAALSPRIALVSVGVHNRYGHPAPATIETLEAAGATILRTDTAGDVSCKMEADRIVVETLR